MSDNSEAPTAAPARKQHRLAGLLKNLALSGCTLLLCVGLLELILRIAGYGNVEIYQPDPVLFWRLKPNQDCYTKVDRKPVHINSQGTRGAEFQTQKPAGTIRIVSLGDSKTFGWGLTETEAYSGLLEKRLLEKFRSKRFEVINAGVNAWSYPQMAAYFRGDALRFQPDFVLLADGNLWTQFSDQVDPKFVKQFMSRVQLKNFLRHFAMYHYFIEVKLKEVYERYRVKFVPVDPKQDALFKEQQQKDPDAFFKQHIDALCQTALTNGVKPVLIYIPMLTDLEEGKTSSVQKAKAGTAQRLGIPFLDFTDDLKPQGKSLYLDADPVHLNVAGNEIVARRLLETLSSLVSP